MLSMHARCPCGWQLATPVANWPPGGWHYLAHASTLHSVWPFRQLRPTDWEWAEARMVH